MSAFKFLGTFLQGTLFGGTYDDLAFEVRVLKGEITRLHERIDKELLEVRDRLDRLEGKPGAGKGKARLSVMSAAAVADAAPSRGESPGPTEGGGGLKVAPDRSEAAPAPVPTRPEGTVGLLAQAFEPEMNLKRAWLLHPGAPRVFARHHLPGCIDCAMSEIESLREGAVGHALDVEALLRDLNQLNAS